MMIADVWQPDEIGKTQVKMTMVGGKVVFER
jgi:predicted amidohydrolase YtcJ